VNQGRVSPRVRLAAVAGQFYPADAVQLRATIRELLAAAVPVPPPKPRARPLQYPKAIIVPHAAYRYSGVVAASAYRALRLGRGQIKRVVLLGPAHYVPLRRIAASSADRWATPLGPVHIDTAGRDALLDADLAVLDDVAHEGEHSLEVQLPFIRTVLGQVRVLPLLVGEVAAARVAELLETVWTGPESVAIVSTDLSHYHDHASAQRLDRETATAICACDPSGVARDRACGIYALRGLLEAARRHSLAVRLLDVRTSGDTSGDLTRVVGYGAFALG
jgi:AmmeMemoRadiSam system protein B